MSYLIDTHCHLDMLEGDLDTFLQNASQNNVQKIIIPAIEPKDFEKIIDISKKYENVYTMLGVFPSEAAKWDDKTDKYIRELVSANKIVAIGEIGLDYYWDKSFTDLQKEVFIKQIELANELNLPIVVHNREAHKDTFDILSEYNKKSEVLFHCFSGSPEFALECVKKGWYIALGGVVTFKNAQKMKDVAKVVPDDKLVLETDAPYLTPVPFRGKQNEPAYIKYTAEEIAKIREVDLEHIEKITSENAERIFKI
ncbi:TatD family hydrolase [bacterium]|nr:TatD family hydrolase [bacterium]